MKSEVFNGARFGAYFKYDFHQMWRNHVKAAIGIGLAGLILYVVWILFGLILRGSWQAPSIGARYFVFMLAFTALELYQTRTYGYLTEKRKGSAWLLIPASGFEKWLSMMIMTLIILPVFFLVSSLGIDALLSVVDPTFGKPIVSGFSDGFQTISGQFIQINETYETTWNPGTFITLAIIGTFVNFLFFLLCGIWFKRFKIIWGFILLFALSITGVAISVLLVNAGIVPSSYVMDIDMEDPVKGEMLIRSFMRWVALISAGIAALLAFLAYRRIKTLKH